MTGMTCNPPYMTGEHGLTNPDYAKAIARHEITCSLEDVVKAAKWLLKTGGHFLYGAQTLSLSGDYLYIKTA